MDLANHCLQRNPPEQLNSCMHVSRLSKWKELYRVRGGYVGGGVPFPPTYNGHLAGELALAPLFLDMT